MAIPIDSEMQDPYISLFAVVHCHLLVLCAANFLPLPLYLHMVWHSHLQAHLCIFHWQVDNQSPNPRTARLFIHAHSAGEPKGDGSFFTRIQIFLGRDIGDQRHWMGSLLTIAAIKGPLECNGRGVWDAVTDVVGPAFEPQLFPLSRPTCLKGIRTLPSPADVNSSSCHPFAFAWPLGPSHGLNYQPYQQSPVHPVTCPPALTYSAVSEHQSSF